jgi:hypothetical protein
MPMSRSKIFGIGLNKTGTKSLNKAVEMLGFSSVHFLGPNKNREVERAIQEGKPMFYYSSRAIQEADAFFDIRAIERYFDVADQQHPRSRFILHTRDLDSWLDSRERHVLRNQEAAAKGFKKGSLLVVDRPAWTEEWKAHHDRVRAYFCDRPHDVLEIHVVDGDGWAKLAPFLGRPIPEEPFPFISIAPRTAASRRAFLRRAGRLKKQVRRAASSRH